LQFHDLAEQGFGCLEDQLITPPVLTQNAVLQLTAAADVNTVAGTDDVVHPVASTLFGSPSSSSQERGFVLIQPSPNFSTSPPDAGDSVSVADVAVNLDGGDVTVPPVQSSTLLSSTSTSEPGRYLLIQLPTLSADALIAVLSCINNNNDDNKNNNNNNEIIFDSSFSSDVHHHRHHHHQQQQQQQPESENLISSTPPTCSGYQLYISTSAFGSGKPENDVTTGSDVTRLSEEDVLWMLDDADLLVVR